MNIVLLGNGYDINYKLLTSYRNFLLIIDFLKTQKAETIHSVGNVYGNNALNSKDRAIKESYELYKDVYDKVLLEAGVIQRLAELAKKNLWFSYFVKSFNKEVGWIDFEKEIAYVLRCFQALFSKTDPMIILDGSLKDKGVRYVILEAFKFLIDDKPTTARPAIVGAKRVKSEYTIEYPLHSNNYVIDKEKIVARLYKELLDFSEMLRLYLKCFVEASVAALVKQSKIEQLKIFDYADVVITFNYTDTYECFGAAADIFHIHGDVHSNIVLGINSDQYDELENVDTSFVAFKKFYQRTLYDTDVPYLRWLRNLLDDGIDSNDLHLVIFGHSLDVTDKDVIEELIGMASKITIFYHNDDAKALYIQKLVAMFGRTKFERIRDEQELSFLPTTIDPSEFSEEMNKNSSLQYMRNLAASAIDPLVFD